MGKRGSQDISGSDNNKDDSNRKKRNPLAPKLEIKNRPKLEIKNRPSSKNNTTTKNAFMMEIQAFYDREMKEMNALFLPLIQSTMKDGEGDPDESLLMEYRRQCERITSMYNPQVGEVYVCGSQDCSQLGMASTNYDSISKLKRLFDHFGGYGGAVHVEAGSVASFVLTKAGKLYSFGSSELGTIGRPTDTQNDELAELRPIQVTGFHPSKHAIASSGKNIPTNEDESIVQISSGVCHSLVLTIRGNVYQFGCIADSENTHWREMPPPDHPDEDDTETELYKGPAPRGYRERPRHLFRIPQKVYKVFTGGSMSVALLVDGTIVTWGIDERGELGQDNDKEQRSVFKRLKAHKGQAKDEDITAEERKKHTTEAKKCLEDIQEHFLLPKKVVYDPPLGQHMVIDVSCGAYHMLVVVRPEPGSLKSVVYGTGLNQYGQLGLGDNKDRQKLTLIPDTVDKNIIKVAAGMHHSLFLSLSGDAIYTCGRSDYGQLGITDKLPKDGSFETTLQRVAFDQDDDPLHHNFHSIAAGEHHSLAVSRSGKLYTWGFGDNEALGHGTSDDETRPKMISKYYSSSGKDKGGVVMEAYGGSQHTIALIR